MNAKSRRRRWLRSLFKALRPLAKLVNPLTLPLAGRRVLPLLVVVEHRGRRSGRAYRTPVYAVRVNDGFVLPLLLGEEADWYRNLRAAGNATLVRGGRRYAIAEPTVVPAADAREAFAAPFRALLSLISTFDSCIRVRVVGGS